MSHWRGHLLLATPAIASGPFARSVVLVLDHDEDGALGVIVNHPLDADVDDVVTGWDDHVAAPTCLFDGGPVAMDSALAVGLLAAESLASVPDGWQAMAGRIGLLDLEGPPPDADQVIGIRVFAGYAGWAPGQLEGEVEEGAWLVVESLPEDVVSPRPESLWHDVMRRQSGDLRFWSTFPDDPGTN